MKTVYVPSNLLLTVSRWCCCNCLISVFSVCPRLFCCFVWVGLVRQELSSWLSTCLVLHFIYRSLSFLSRLMSWTEYEIGSYRFLIITFLSTYNYTDLSNLKRDIFEIQHPKFENCRLGKIGICEPAHEIIAGTYHIGDQHSRSLARAFAVRTPKVWKWMKDPTNNQTSSPNR